jgi:hypothetical protein
MLFARNKMEQPLVPFQGCSHTMDNGLLDRFIAFEATLGAKQLPSGEPPPRGSVLASVCLTNYIIFSGPEKVKNRPHTLRPVSG